MIRVKATREGRIGHPTASGYVVDARVPFVALPSRGALGRFVRLHNPRNGRRALAVVLDIGPWNEADDPYVFGGARPAAERGEHVVVVDGARVQRIEPGKVNGAGIDLSEPVWRQLGMAGNTPIDWEFVEP